LSSRHRALAKIVAQLSLQSSNPHLSTSAFGSLLSLKNPHAQGILEPKNGNVATFTTYFRSIVAV
jgi:hypothetical protein